MRVPQIAIPLILAWILGTTWLGCKNPQATETEISLESSFDAGNYSDDLIQLQAKKQISSADLAALHQLISENYHHLDSVWDYGRLLKAARQASDYLTSGLECITLSCSIIESADTLVIEATVECINRSDEIFSGFDLQAIFFDDAEEYLRRSPLVSFGKRLIPMEKSEAKTWTLKLPLSDQNASSEIERLRKIDCQNPNSSFRHKVRNIAFPSGDSLYAHVLKEFAPGG
jgi:hypothetical protein